MNDRSDSAGRYDGPATFVDEGEVLGFGNIDPIWVCVLTFAPCPGEVRKTRLAGVAARPDEKDPADAPPSQLARP